MSSELSGSPQRLPWFETLLSRMRAQPLEARQDLLEATRRLMAAAPPIRPLDRLHWLAMRQRLHRAGSGAARTGSATAISQLPQAEVEAIAAYTAYLSRLVPLDGQAARCTAAAGAAWYASAMQGWEAHAEVPGVPAARCRRPGPRAAATPGHGLDAQADAGARLAERRHAPATAATPASPTAPPMRCG